MEERAFADYVRFIGEADQRIKENYLRILRYFRFYSLFGLEEPNKKAIEACRENCAGLKKVPMERIKEELFKLIQTPNAPRAYRLMQENNILSSIMPDAPYVDDLAYFNNASENAVFEDDALIKLFILYRPNPALAENLAVRLKFSRREKNLFVALAEKEFDETKKTDPAYLQKQVYLYGKDFVKGKLLTHAVANKCFDSQIWKIYDQTAQFPERTFPLRGKDLLAEQLCTPEQVGNILKELEQEWVDSDFTLSKEDLLAQVKNH